MEISPSDLNGQLQTIRRLVSQNRIADADSLCARLIECAPTSSDAFGLAAEIALRCGRAAMAEEYSRKAIMLAPDDLVLVLRHAQILLVTDRRREAREVLVRMTESPPTDPALLDTLGALLTHLEEADLGVRFLLQAVEQRPDSTSFKYNLAMAQRMCGDFEGAEKHLDDVIAARPNDAEAFQARSDLRRQSLERNHVDELEGALTRLQGQRASIPIGFALAKELEDVGDYARSFATLQKACDSYRRSLRYDVATDVAVLDKLRRLHTKEALEKVKSSCANEECIFILGLPRTGTTLVERILGSHPAVFAGGELNAFPKAIIEAVAHQRTSASNKSDFVTHALEVDFSTLGETYLAETRPRTGHTDKFTDKLPLNYLYAGLIHAALPNARFVALHRHPMDACFAMYRTLFAAAYPFTYDLGDLGRYYVAWSKLMRHWEEIVGDAWETISYENLVANQEPVTRDLLQHCGLTWDDRCMNFHSRGGAVSTASAAQVRRQLYPDSVGKWRRYAAELDTLRRYLDAHGIDAG